MSELKIAARYAKSLFDFAQQQNVIELVKEDILLLQRTLRENIVLQAVLRNPIVPQDKKLKILDSLFISRMQSVTISFFKLLVKKGRSDVLKLITQAFLTQYNTTNSIIRASFVVSEGCSEALQDNVRKIVKQATGKNVILETTIDSTLLGGFILTVEDRQVDASILGKLNRLRRSLR